MIDKLERWQCYPYIHGLCLQPDTPIRDTEKIFRFILNFFKETGCFFLIKTRATDDVLFQTLLFYQLFSFISYSQANHRIDVL